MPRRTLALLTILAILVTVPPVRRPQVDAQIVSGDMMGEFLYSTDSLIVAVSPDGANRRTLFPGTGAGYDGHATWSPDGLYVAFNTYGYDELGSDAIYIGNVRDQTFRQLVATSRLHVYEPSAWSPDGTRLAFVAAESPTASLWERDIWIINVDGSGLHQIREHATQEGQQRLLGPPAWSPDGTQMVFIEAPVDASPQNQVPVSVMIMNADGSDPRHLFDVETFYNPDGGLMDRLAWSPDGSRLAFGANPSSFTGVDGVIRLYVANLDGSDMHVITTPSGDLHQPVWSPDGNFVAYAGYGGISQQGIFVTNLEGTWERLVPNTGGTQSIDWTAGAVEARIVGVETTNRNIQTVIDSDTYVLDNCGSPAQRTDTWRIQHEITRSLSFVTSLSAGTETSTCVGTNRTTSWHVGGELGPIKDIITISGQYGESTEQTSDVCDSVSQELTSAFSLTEQHTVTEERTFSVELPPDTIVKYEVTVNEVSIQGYVTVLRTNGFYEDQVQVPFSLRDRIRIDARPVAAACDNVEG